MVEVEKTRMLCGETERIGTGMVIEGGVVVWEMRRDLVWGCDQVGFLWCHGVRSVKIGRVVDRKENGGQELVVRVCWFG